MEKSAGLLIILNNEKILLGHPTNSSWDSRLSFSKGHLESGENSVEAAMRETKEEFGIDIPFNFIDRFENKINYTDKKGKIYKVVYYFLVKIDFKDWISIMGENLNKENNLIIPKSMLQLDEIDWAGFLTKKEAIGKIFWRFKDCLNYLK
jgi:ADP-ribose pyrophosphatase YjhB (NUDIX family)